MFPCCLFSSASRMFPNPTSFVVNFTLPVALQLPHPNFSPSPVQSLHHFLVASTGYVPCHEIPAPPVIAFTNVENCTSRSDWHACSFMTECAFLYCDLCLLRTHSLPQNNECKHECFCSSLQWEHNPGAHCTLSKLNMTGSDGCFCHLLRLPPPKSNSTLNCYISSTPTQHEQWLAFVFLIKWVFKYFFPEKNTKTCTKVESKGLVNYSRKECIQWCRGSSVSTGLIYLKTFWLLSISVFYVCLCL